MNRRRIVFISIIVAGAALDLVTKSVAFARLGTPQRRNPPPGVVEVIPGIMRFETAENTGVAWGMLSERKARWALAALSLIAFPAIVWFFWRHREPSWPLTLGLAGIAGGTLGNLYDRVVFGHVRDFIYVYCINFPVFNVADSCICVGAALFALENLLSPKKEAAAASGETPAARERG